MKDTMAPLIAIVIIACSILFVVVFPKQMTRAYAAKVPRPVSKLYMADFPLDSLVIFDSGEEALADMTGQKKKVVAFLSNRCPHCINYLKNLTKVRNSFDTTLTFVSVFNKPSLPREFLEQQAANQPLYYSNHIDIAKEVRRVPTLFFINEDNKVLGTRTGAPSSAAELEALFSAFEASSSEQSAREWMPALGNVTQQGCSN